MAAAEVSEAGGAAIAGERGVVTIWLRHLLAFWFPANACLFLATGPHPWYVAWLFVLPLALAHHWDTSGRIERRQPRDDVPAWPFDAIVYALVALQLVNVALLARLFSVQGFWSLDFLLAVLVVGASSGYQIITAHELIHRTPRWEQMLGRLLLCTVLYEHFYTEHIRGHHVRVGTPDDPATARFGESFHRFYFRTVPAQFASAWRLEKKRLGDESMPLLDRRMLRHRVLHGLVVEWGLAFAILAFAGAVAFAAFVLQALFASRLLEIVNYFEHWGLVREGKRVAPIDSWDTHSWFTYYALIGLSRHADHHAWAARPYQKLRVWDEAPILPSGYVGMIPLVVLANRRFQKLATEELRRRRLGPFRDAA
ncbi:MAG: fatty acid desaturase [Proteobacteria bacterium]|nr:MAG: fatty acid desaturase [Pseudomonadota bacterium]